MRSAHSEGIQIHGETEKWDKTTHTTLTECSAYGKINFLDEDTTIQPEVSCLKVFSLVFTFCGHCPKRSPKQIPVLSKKPDIVSGTVQEAYHSYLSTDNTLPAKGFRHLNN